MNFSFNRNLLINIIGRSWTPILSIFFLPIMVKLMGVEAYGLVGFYVTMINVVSILELGMGQTINRQLSRLSIFLTSCENSRDLSRTFEYIIFSITLLVALFFFIAAPYISGNWLKDSNLPHNIVLNSIRLMGFAIAFQFPQSFYNNGLMALDKQLQANLFLIVYGTFRVIGSVAVIYFISNSPEVFFTWHLVISLIGLLILFTIFWKFLPKSDTPLFFNSVYLKENLIYSAFIFGNTVINVILTQIDKVLLSKTLTLTMFSYYTIAITLASGIGMIIAPISSLVFPQYVRLKENKYDEELKSLFHRTSQTLVILLFPLCAVLICYSKPLIFLWMKDNTIAENSYLISSLFILGGGIHAVTTLPMNCAAAFGWSKLIFWSNLIKLILMIPLICLLVINYQGIGSGISWIIINSLYLVIVVPMFFRRFFSSEIKSWYLNDIGIPFLVVAIVCGLTRLMFSDLKSHFHVLVWIGGAWIFTTLILIFFLPYVRYEVEKNFFCYLNR